MTTQAKCRPTVLIADDDRALLRALSLRCRELGLDVCTATDGLDAYRQIVARPPALLLLDEHMPGSSGLSLFEQLAVDAGIPPMPAIVLTGRSDPETIERCRRLGAFYVWKGLETWNELAPLITRLLGLPAPAGKPAYGEPAESPAENAAAGWDGDPEGSAAPTDRVPRVLVVDDDPGVSKALKIRLGTYGVEVLRAFNAMQGFWMALRERPDVVITDYRMPETFGNYLIARLGEHPLTKDIPVIVFTGCCADGATDFGLERDLRRIGAAGYLSKPLNLPALLTELRRFIQVTDPVGVPEPACQE